MCFFLKQSKKAKEIKDRFKVQIEEEGLFKIQEYLNGFSHPSTPIICNEDPSFVKHFDWGLIPHWAKDHSIRKHTLNARIESIHEKPSFKEVVNNRCLILTDGFFEWKWLDLKGKSKQKYQIGLPNDELFAFGGIWSEWLNRSTGEIVKSYSIVTTAANDLMSEIHNTKKRMPVVLNESNEQYWLDGGEFNDFKNVNIELKATAI